MGIKMKCIPIQDLDQDQYYSVTWPLVAKITKVHRLFILHCDKLEKVRIFNFLYINIHGRKCNNLYLLVSTKYISQFGKMWAICLTGLQQQDRNILMSWYWCFNILPHLSLGSHKGDIDKQCGPRSDAKECDIWSESTLFALNTGISVKHGYIKTNHTSLILEMDQSEEL